MTKRNGRPPKRKRVQHRPQPESTGWRTMTYEQLTQASTALGCDPEDTTDEEKAMLDRYIELGGNVWAL